jgi:SAM-dependent methyltransferase
MTRAPASPELEHVPCNLCGGRDVVELYRGFEHRYFDDPREWPVVRCRACSLAFLNPRPTREVIGAYYPKPYYHQRDTEPHRARYDYQLSLLDALPRGRLLDVGCAEGDWLVRARERGWQVSGIEPGSARNPHGIELHSSPFPDAGVVPNGSFHAVTAWAVFEHLHDPLSAFRRVEELLVPGGRFLAMVPNVDSIASRWAFIEDVPRHLYFFSRATLAAFGRASGLRLVGVEQCPQFFSGLGKGALRIRAFGSTTEARREWFRFVGLSRRERLRRAPVRAVIDLAVGAVESAVLRPSLVRALGWSGHVVGVFEKPLG